MIVYKTLEEIALMREAGRIVAQVFAYLQKGIQPGVMLSEIDRLAEDYLRKYGAEPLYKGYRQFPDQPPFPGVITTSVNQEVCHGIPDRRMLRQGDIIGIDIGLRYRGWCGDACVTYGVGRISKKAQRLLQVARECLEVGIRAAQPGNHLGDIGAAIQSCAERNGYQVVREYGGHGIGRELHESPFVPHFGPAGKGLLLKPGLVLAIEPMINAGTSECVMKDDGWTAVTADGSLSAQFEHTVAITQQGPVILSLP